MPSAPRARLLGSSCVLLALPSVAFAATPTHACIAAHADGQVERDAGRLLSAREKFVFCADEACPALVRKECLQLQESVHASLPSVVLSAVDSAGRALPVASAVIDGSRSLDKLDGSAIELDPGQHRVEVVLRDGRRQTVEIKVLEGEQRRVTATFERTPNDAPQSSQGPSPLAYVFAGLGVVALGSFVGFAVDGNSRQSTLRRGCAPNCQREHVAAMRRSHLIADISLGVSVAALGASAYFFLRAPERALGQSKLSSRDLLLGLSGHF
jgi:hypothetical protein